MGLVLFDAKTPSAPTHLATFALARPVSGVDLVRIGDGRTLALVATAGAEAAGGTGDLFILDVTTPTAPTQLAVYGVVADAGLGASFASAAVRGVSRAVWGFDVTANGAGTRAYLSYGDAGTIVLYITDPTAPTRVGRSTFNATEEDGDAFASALRGPVLVEVLRDTAPHHLDITSAALASPSLGTVPTWGGSLAGPLPAEVVFVGRGCPATSFAPSPDPYLADPAGKIALIERGVCNFDHKVGRAQQAGALAALIFDRSSDTFVAMAGTDPVTLPDGSVVDITIPASFMLRSVALTLAAAAQPVSATLAYAFDGYGTVRILDAANPSVVHAVVSIPQTSDETLPAGTWYPSDVAVAGSTAFVAWQRGGVRAISLAGDGRSPVATSTWSTGTATASAVAAEGDIVVALDALAGQLHVLTFRASG